MQELINGFFDWGMTSPYGQYFILVSLVAYVLSHVVQYLPVSLTRKIPDFVMTAINILAAKHGVNKSAETDIKGNVKYSNHE